MALKDENVAPEWMLRLESKRNRHNRLAHEIGAGSPCLVCGDSCPGLDLHFWRKLCRNCKCKKEDHDVKDDDGYEQFEILLGAGSKRKKGGILKLKVPDDPKTPVVLYEGGSRGVSFDWLPPNVSEEVAAEYMQQLPASKLPISGSDGALYRRQQLEKQVPLHDLDAKHCHNLTPEEIEQLMKYLDNLKNNVVGQGCVGKVPMPYSEARPSLLGPTAMLAGSQAHGRSLSTSQSADTIRPLPPMPPAYNSAPRPFCPSAVPGGHAQDDDLPPPLPMTLPPRAGLKTPSDFFANWQLPPTDKKAVGQMTDTLGSLTLHPQGGAGSHFMKENVPTELSVSSNSASVVPQFSSNLPSQSPPESAATLRDPTTTQVVFSEGTHQQNPEWSSTLPGEPSPAAYASSMTGKTPESGVLWRVEGRPMGTADYVRSMLGDRPEALSGSLVPSGMSTGSVGSVPEPFLTEREKTPFVHTAHSDESAGVMPGKARPLGGSSVMGTTGFNPLGGNITRLFPTGSVQESMLHPKDTAYSTAVPHHGVPGRSLPLHTGTLGSSTPLISANAIATDFTQQTTLNPKSTVNSTVVPQQGLAGESGPLQRGAEYHASAAGNGTPLGVNSTEAFPGGFVREPFPHPTGTSHSSAVNHQGIAGVSGPLQGPRNMAPYSQGHGSQLSNPGSIARDSPLESEMPSSVLRNPPDSLQIEGVITSNVFPHNTVNSTAVGTDALPKSAHAMQQKPAMIDPSSAGVCAGTSAALPAETPGGGTAPHLDCHECREALQAGDVAVFAERASSAVWHPGCFVCATCKELLVDLMYFYHKGNVYCGRHFADLLEIPRCFACDELIFVKEYTVAEGKAFHVKHFCCYECDEPLGGKQYIPVDEQPVCLECYERKYGKQCHTCGKKIHARDQRMGWKHLNWHAQGVCFRCFECAKSLLGGRLIVKEDQPFCSTECVQAGLTRMAGIA